MLRLESVVEDYRRASVNQRIDMILQNFSRFEAIIDCFEKNLSIQIKEEVDYNRHAARGNLGVRVQTSAIANSTQNIACDRDSIEKAVKAGDYITALQGADNYETHRAEILTLQKMRNDYYRVNNLVNSLDPRERRIFKKYILKEATITDIADVENLTFESVKTRIKKSRKQVRSCAAVEMMNATVDFSLVEKKVA